MESWKMAAILTGVTYGLYNVFTRLAAGKVSDVLGAGLMEIVAAAVLVLVASGLYLRDPSVIQWTKAGLFLSALAGLSIAILSVLYLMTFRLGAPLSVAGPAIVVIGSAVMVFVGLICLREPFTMRLAFGIVLGFSSIYLLMSQS
ncbi:MAG: hypothetical protein COV74_05895 [Candidatus Omnitrophica bacterium CG11_big_fil_rev_8_21_14_0_20_45_26]|uniref:EamA domain-containing protein n=1 Tax=Candidatus Abzuiibacterium crystallinum TaxID=1974748 RepID=A0A2H0LPA3_9BACT|nr:MAG: hypothetical protein COV74_05895 [Candidatus Omnitrophica bacterium CG11_big_fil_rev_8_21_14_0_20_45_26]PIW64101.1 MAG: hypothetical protein COW12_07630 [Candidatus Omnitrophica bacterium CG12_big_fil_rev_8_21_14_0_65_45_16]